MSQSPPLACQKERDELVDCILRTDCVLKQNKTPKECLASKENLPLQCQHLLSSFSDCKRGLLDMRRRFRGNHLTEQAKRGHPPSSGDAALGEEK